jgi:putative PIN family toxin of toxin-antitoxin system
MKVVIDTSVLVSAAWRDREPQAVILFIVRHPEIEWVVSAEILAEYQQVLARPKLKLSEAQQQEWHALVEASTRLIPSPPVLNFPRDPKDAKFLACARAAEADYLITGDRDFTAARRLVSTTILSVALFKKLVCDVER